jgi:acetoin:2,6-dichlorophenolindophenol oxidoreductase subunit beta
MRTLSYAEAISEGTVQAMDRDPSVFIAGIAVD